MDEAVVVRNTAEPEVVETPLESLASICTVLAVGLFLMTFIFQNYVIPSGSMEKTLLVGDHVLVDRMTLAPPTKWASFVHYREVRRGDIIVFHEAEPGDAGPGAGEANDRGAGGSDSSAEWDRLPEWRTRRTSRMAAKPQADNDPQDAYDPARDDFPAQRGAGGSTELWAQD